MAHRLPHLQLRRQFVNYNWLIVIQGHLEQLYYLVFGIQAKSKRISLHQVWRPYKLSENISEPNHFHFEFYTSYIIFIYIN